MLSSSGATARLRIALGAPAEVGDVVDQLVGGLDGDGFGYPPAVAGALGEDGDGQV